MLEQLKSLKHQIFPSSIAHLPSLKLSNDHVKSSSGRQVTHFVAKRNKAEKDARTWQLHTPDMEIWATWNSYFAMSNDDLDDLVWPPL